MRPQCQITIDGAPASGLFMERLASCTVVDEEGITSDRVEIVLNDSPPAAIPRRGAVISVHMGYAGALAFMGEFVAEEIELAVLPFRLRVTGKATDLGGKAKDQKERHWDNVTLGDLVTQIAKENGLKAAVHPSLASFQYDWIGQVGESDVAFLERIAGRHDALFSVKRQTVIFAPRGTGQSPTGADLTAITLTPDVISPDSCSFLQSERTRFEEVAATWMDRAAGKRREVKVPAAKDGEGVYTIDQPFASQKEAKAAAEAKARELLRQALTFRARIVGDVSARGGAPVVFSRVRPGMDGQQFIIETATHGFTPGGGYVTEITGKAKV